jgi:hypothetical protein
MPGFFDENAYKNAQEFLRYLYKTQRISFAICIKRTVDSSYGAKPQVMIFAAFAGSLNQIPSESTACS